jgi:hypothetical protein
MSEYYDPPHPSMDPLARVDPPLDVIRPPRPPQRMLGKPIARKPKSASDIPHYEGEPVRGGEVPWHVQAVLQAARGTAPTSSNGRTMCKPPPNVQLRHLVPTAGPPRDWVVGLIGKIFSEALPIISTKHIPYRILQIDGVMLNSGLRVNRSELLLTLTTNEGFKQSGPGADDKARDQMRVSVWFSQNNDGAVINTAKMSKNGM